ncbi:LssY C-terminal domain-containing protein [Propioniciclava soli]|uniref:LssY C-terminal domain-containing protein n=1 Tax=Propioniciclava soli TaxID=2775081 RepID=A0ABZ3CAN8_9ACTN
MVARYPVPARPPSYGEVAPQKVSAERRVSVHRVVDSFFIAVAMVLTLWFAAVLLVQGISLSWSRLLYLVVFWALLTYLALPRLHQFFTLLYVPEYFIGRTRTGDGLLGDPINLALNGDERDIHAALQGAGWVLADEITVRSAGGMIASALLRRSYPEAPVSSLFLFGERHAFANQQEVDNTVSQRHHVRFWRTPPGWLLPGGRGVEWLAAGTFDRSVGLSMFTGQFTHKIDENIDLERDYIVNSVRYADPEVGIDVIQDFSTSYHARNGGGDRIRTDGDLPILNVHGAETRREEPTRLPAHRPARSHGVPPLPLIVALTLLLGQTVWFGVWWWVTGAGRTLAADDEIELAVNLAAVAFMLLLLGLCTLILLRRRWAKLIVMSLIAVTTVSDLIDVSVARANLDSVLTSSVGVLVLLCLSADSVRSWVSFKRGGRVAKRDREVTVPAP